MANRLVRLVEFVALIMGALASDGGGTEGGENVGYLTAVSVWKISISIGEDLILSASEDISSECEALRKTKNWTHSFQ